MERELLTKKAAARGLNNIRFYGHRPAVEMPGIYALANVLLIHLKDDPLFRITIPHKTFVYMAVAKPILAAVEGDVADIVVAAGAGITCRPSQPLLLADAVRLSEYAVEELSELVCHEWAARPESGARICVRAP